MNQATFGRRAVVRPPQSTMQGSVPAPATQHAGDLARPWQRYWARIFDLLLYAAGLWAFWKLVTHGLVIPRAFSSPGAGFLLNMAALPLSLLIDAFIIGLFGNSLGKALVGICVELPRRVPPDFSMSLRRNMRLYFSGFGLGLPLVSLVTVIYNYFRVRGGEETSWDQALDTRVHDIRGSIARTTATAIFCIVAMFAFAYAVTTAALAAAGVQYAVGANPDSADPFASVRRAMIEQQLKTFASTITPQQVDHATLLQGADADGLVLTFHYAITSPDVQSDGLLAYLRQTVPPQACGNADMARMMQHYGVTYRYSYLTPNSSEPIVESVTWANCQHSSPWSVAGHSRH